MYICVHTYTRIITRTSIPTHAHTQTHRHHIYELLILYFDLFMAPWVM